MQHPKTDPEAHSSSCSYVLTGLFPNLVAFLYSYDMVLQHALELSIGADYVGPPVLSLTQALKWRDSPFVLIHGAEISV